jgi:hypothetical protein
MIHFLDASRSTARLATSALPDAPVIAEAAPAPARPRSALAALLRRAADRLAPEPSGLTAQ